MAETFAIVGETTSLIAITLHSSRVLYDDLNAVKDNDKNMEPIVNDLESVIDILTSLDQALKNQAQAGNVPLEFDSANVQAASKNCDRICTAFHVKLQDWTKHSPNGKMDKLRIGFFAEKEILELRAQLSLCKGTFTLAIIMENRQVPQAKLAKVRWINNKCSRTNSIKQAQNTELIIAKPDETGRAIDALNAVVRAQLDNISASIRQFNQKRLREQDNQS